MIDYHPDSSTPSGWKIFEAVMVSMPNGVSRASLARQTGLSKPTVSAVVYDFEQAGLVRQVNDRPEGAVGRPPAMYEIIPEAGYVVGVDIGATKTIVGVADLLGRIVAEEKFPTGRNASLAIEGVVARVSMMMPDLRGDTSAICVGVPGVYQAGSNRVEEAPNLPGFDDIDISAFFTKHLGTPHVYIDNDVNLAAVAESDAIDGEDVAAISIGTGIGLGMTIGGNLYRGGSGAAGEIGSVWLIPPTENGLPSRRLEDIAAAGSIKNLFQSAIIAGYKTILNEKPDVPEIFEAAMREDEAAQYVLRQVANALAVAVSHLSLIADPGHVVFGGGIGQNEILVNEIRQQVDHLVPYPPRISVSNLGGRSTMLGAVSTATRFLQKWILTPAGKVR